MISAMVIAGFFGILCWMGATPRNARAVAAGTILVTLLTLVFFVLAATGR